MEEADALADVNAQLADLAARPVGASPDDIAALKADLEKRLAEVPAAIDPAPLIARATEGIEALIAALDQALTDHGLVKVRFTDHKAERKQLASDLATRTSARQILLVGHTVTLYRTPATKQDRH
jgi:RNA-binding protein YhbY